MFYATGMADADMDKPQVGIASVWYEGNPCNMHLLTLAEKVKEGVAAAGMVGMRFNTIGVSDGISMGTDGMSFSLQSRDLIADSIETVMGGQWYDANISLPGCDKNMPGCLIAMGRLNRPSLMVYGGTIRAGHGDGDHKLDVDLGVSELRTVSRRRDHRAAAAGDRAPLVSRRRRVRRHVHRQHDGRRRSKRSACRLPYSSSTPAEDPQKLDECVAAGAAVLRLLELDLKPRDIMTASRLRERDGAGHGARRIDQRRAAPDRDGAIGRACR